jgi:hypothetical protein
MHRFKAAVKDIAKARDAQGVEGAVSRFLVSLTQSERASIEDAVGYTLPHAGGLIPSVAHDLTKAELRAASGDVLNALVSETAQVFIIAANRLSQLAIR